MHRLDHQPADDELTAIGVAAQQPLDHAHRDTLVDQLICASGARR